MDLDAATDELYQLPPERFVARRTELAAQARASGDGEARAALGSLRRPTVAAWAVNLLVRARPVELAELVQLAESLRDAQRELETDELRRLTTQRRAAVAALVAAAREAAHQAGRTVSDPVLLEVQATLDAAVADAGAQRAVLSGRLTTSLSYSGFGGVDLADAVAATPPSRARLKVVREASAADVGRA
ncbi:MAG: hypothetical protein M3O28_12245, partial [Actinomycetota bacterium]|nr:hypothetical protein [Actinomycetota bacterium]